MLWISLSTWFYVDILVYNLSEKFLWVKIAIFPEFFLTLRGFLYTIKVLFSKKFAGNLELINL